MNMLEILKMIWIIVGCVFGVALIFAIIVSFVKTYIIKENEEDENVSLEEMIEFLKFVEYLNSKIEEEKSKENNDKEKPTKKVAKTSKKEED